MKGIWIFALCVVGATCQQLPFGFGGLYRAPAGARVVGPGRPAVAAHHGRVVAPSVNLRVVGTGGTYVAPRRNVVGLPRRVAHQPRHVGVVARPALVYRPPAPAYRVPAPAYRAPAPAPAPAYRPPAPAPAYRAPLYRAPAPAPAPAYIPPPPAAPVYSPPAPAAPSYGGATACGGQEYAADPNDSSAFLQCSNGIVHKQKCPSGTVSDQGGAQCNAGYASGAPQYAAPAGPQYAAPVGPQYAAPVGPQYAAPVGPPYAAPAAPQYAAPGAPQYAPAPAAPQYAPPAAPGEEYVPSPDPVCGSSGANGYLPGPDCQTFIQCSNGLATTMSCPEGLAWSQSALKCVQSYDSDCNAAQEAYGQQGYAPPAQDYAPQDYAPQDYAPVPQQDYAPAASGYASLDNSAYSQYASNPTDYQDPSGCQSDGLHGTDGNPSYTLCSNGTPYTQQCPSGTVWSSGAQRCENGYRK